jgi:hypothetical protein
VSFAASAFSTPFLAYTPFLHPLKIWDYWPWLLVPLCFGVSVVYKSVRERSMRRIPLEALKATLWIIAGMSAAGAALMLLVRFMAR